MAARKLHTTLRDDWKAKIQASHIVNRFVKHFNGELELTQSQIKVGEILLKKTVPDLARQEIIGDDQKPVGMIIKWHDPE